MFSIVTGGTEFERKQRGKNGILAVFSPRPDGRDNCRTVSFQEDGLNGRHSGKVCDDTESRRTGKCLHHDRVARDEQRLGRAETRARVLSVIADLDYQPNINARSLVGDRSFLIGLFIEDVVGSYAYDFQAGAVERCREAGMHLMLEPWNAQDPDLGDKITKLVRQLRLEAVILLPPHSDNQLILARLKEENIPVVRIAPNDLNRQTPVVRVDDYAAARAMTEHLLAYGHRRIGFMRGAPGHRATEDRYRGFLDVMSEHDLPVLPQFVLDGNFSFDDGEVAARKMLTAENRPTAIFTSGDDMAVGVFSVAQQLGLRLPDELLVTGFDDSPVSRMTWPRLTTIRQPVRAMGWAATDMIIEHSPKRHGWPDPMPERLFEFELVVRNSTAMLRE